jgi:drug/metabolite transporter, DME family
MNASETSTRTSSAAVSSVLVAALLWGTTGTAQALGPDTSSALGVGALRLVIGGAALALIAAVGGHLLGQPWRAARRSVITGGFWVAVYQLAFFEATRRAGVATATLVTIASAPVFSHLLAVRRSGVRPTRHDMGALAVIAVGVSALGADGGGDAGTSPVLGVISALLAGLGYACYAQRGRDAIDAGLHSTASMAGLFCVGAAFAAFTLPWQPLDWVATGEGIVMLAHLGIVTLALGYVLYGWGLGRLPVPTVVTLSLAEPAVAAVLAMVVLDEMLTPIGWSGVVLIAVGLAATARRAASAPSDSGVPLPSRS